MTKPYADAPRLPDAPSLDPRQLFRVEEAVGQSARSAAPAHKTVGQSVRSAAPAETVAPPPGDRAARRVELELGVGTGAFVMERLEQHPDLCMIGLEVRRKWASLADERLRRRGLGARGRVFAEDARSALTVVVDASISAVFIHFPDPWWKKRHRKRLLVTSALLGEIARVLEPGGELFIQTDVSERAELYERLAADEPMLEPRGSGTGTARVDENPYGVRSPRERRAMADGLPIVRLLYRRRPA
jgi:tRNA (guanine-N7-)-methyltransferase